MLEGHCANSRQLYLLLIVVSEEFALAEIVPLFLPVTEYFVHHYHLYPLSCNKHKCQAALLSVDEIIELLVPPIRRLVQEVWWWWWASALRWSTFLW